TCSPSFTLAVKAGDPTGNFLATPTSDGSSVFATNTNGSLYRWPVSGCSVGCQPTAAVAVHTPAGDPNFRQAVATGNGLLFVLAQQTVGGTAHVVALGLDASNLSLVVTRDLGQDALAP